MPPIHFWRHTQKNSNVFLARSDHTANVYRDLQGLYREIRLQGSRIYRDIIGVILAVTITGNFCGKLVTNTNNLFCLHVVENVM